MKQFILLVVLLAISFSICFAQVKLEEPNFSILAPAGGGRITELEPLTNFGIKAKRYDWDAMGIKLKAMWSILPAEMVKEMTDKEILAVLSKSVLERLIANPITIKVQTSEISTNCGNPIKVLNLTFQARPATTMVSVRIDLYIMGRQHWMVNAMAANEELLKNYDYFFKSFKPIPNCKYIKGQRI